MTITDIVQKIQTAKPTHKPILIAIEGFGGSGKSTLARNLETALDDAYVIHIDDFFLWNVKSDANKSNFDRKRLKEQVLLPVKNNQPAAYQGIDDSTQVLGEFIQVPDVTYLIIEGVSSFHPDIADYMDYKIWVGTSSKVAEARGRKRDKELGDGNEELWEHWTNTYQEYKDLHQPDKRADIIFDTM